MEQLVPQGVLDLDHSKRPREDDWSHFRGLAGATPKRPEAPQKKRSFKRAKTQPTAARSDTTEPLANAPQKPRPTVKTTDRTSPPEAPRAPVLPENVAVGCTRELDLTNSKIEDTAEHFAVPTDDPVDDVDFTVDIASADESVLDLSESNEWSFGDTIDPDLEDGDTPLTPPPLDPALEQRIRNRARRATRSGPPFAGRFVHGLSAIASGRRGLVLLALVGLLGAFGAGYRACSGLVETQLTEADEALAAADGESLLKAVKLYEDNVSADHTRLTERLDFANALLAADYGHEISEVEYPVDEAITAYGAAAIALAELATGDVVEARDTALAAVRTFSDEWISHWTVGRIATCSADWDHAEDAFERAHELDNTAVLPLVSLLDIALRAGREEHAQSWAHALSELHPEHPMVAISGPLATYGIDPVRGANHRLDVVLPDPEQQNLSRREIELVHYIRARQALAAGDVETVVRTLRHLRTVDGIGLGVRVSLLDAVVAARNFQLDFTLTAVERASSATPEDCPAREIVENVATAILEDLGRPDLALEQLSDRSGNNLHRARLHVDVGAESAALRMLGALMDEAPTRRQALRILVDFHLRRGAPDRARLRAGGLETPDQHFARARIAADEGRWDEAKDHAEQALRLHPDDFESLVILVHAFAHLDVPEQAAERIQSFAAGSVLTGRFHRLRLEVLTIYGRAPRETIVEYLGSLENVGPTSVITLAALALGYEVIGDLDRARELAEQVLGKEPNNRSMHALLGRLLHQIGERDGSQRHLRSYLALSPETVATDWAHALLAEQ